MYSGVGVAEETVVAKMRYRVVADLVQCLLTLRKLEQRRIFMIIVFIKPPS